jgi:superfamily II DNA/RNA helicase
MGHSVASLHGGMPQGRRNRVLQGLRTRQLRVLVATDVAARGIDVPTISHVINYGLPMKAEDYVHRIGRTGRAGRSGLAVTLAERCDTQMIQRIQRFTTQRIPPAVIAGLEPRPAPAGAGKPSGANRRWSPSHPSRSSHPSSPSRPSHQDARQDARKDSRPGPRRESGPFAKRNQAARSGKPAGRKPYGPRPA